ncbi:MAG: hypothetical protein B6U76_06555 [Desulfurococcales archaeon ex4484_217_2]|nr:MAG: hypothetical protein B6U76_06555 [Desulfurococcales archaeon ex4484_217_2]
MRKFKYENEHEKKLGDRKMEVTFESKISKSGEKYLITIPRKITPMIKSKHGKRVTVKITIGD